MLTKLFMLSQKPVNDFSISGERLLRFDAWGDDFGISRVHLHVLLVQHRRRPLALHRNHNSLICWNCGISFQTFDLFDVEKKFLISFLLYLNIEWSFLLTLKMTDIVRYIIQSKSHWENVFIRIIVISDFCNADL